LSAFADSSALVKLYADEDGYQQVRGMASIAVAQLARVEVPAALWRKQRLGELKDLQWRRLRARHLAGLPVPGQQVDCP
jgi:predicted nucleic acid-binding protein